jgi:hypothetical protein
VSSACHCISNTQDDVAPFRLTTGWEQDSRYLKYLMSLKCVYRLTVTIQYGSNTLPVVQLLQQITVVTRSSGFDSRRGLGIFLFTTASTTSLGPTQPPIQWVPEALSLGVKRLGHEADHSPPSSAEVKEWAELYLQSPNTPSWRGAQLTHRDNFTFYLYLVPVVAFNI